MFRRFGQRLEYLFRRDRLEHDLDEELRTSFEWWRHVAGRGVVGEGLMVAAAGVLLAVAGSLCPRHSG